MEIFAVESYVISDVKSVLLYGSETWKEICMNSWATEAFVNECLRYIFGDLL